MGCASSASSASSAKSEQVVVASSQEPSTREEPSSKKVTERPPALARSESFDNFDGEVDMITDIPLDEEQLLLVDRIRSIPFFNVHSLRQIKQIASAMKKEVFEAGQVVFNKGDTEDAFYIIKDDSSPSGLIADDGSGNQVAFELNFFGETCLRYNNVCRRYKLMATERVTLLKISPDEYRNLIIRQAKQQEYQYMHFLRKVPILKDLMKEQLQALGRSLRHARFADGTKIITQGSYGSTFYFVESGTVKCVQRTAKGQTEVNTEVNRYSAGDYFGEGALLQDAPRNADVIAVGEVTCLTLLRNDFNDLLGSVQQLLEHNFRARVLKGVDLLKSLTDAERSELADLLVDIVYDPGEQILQQGAVGDRFYIIKEGEVRFTRDPKIDEACSPCNLVLGERAESELLERPKDPNDVSMSSTAAAAAAVAVVASMAPHTGAQTPPPTPSRSVSSAQSGVVGSGGKESVSSAENFQRPLGLASDADHSMVSAERDLTQESNHIEIGRLFTGQYFGEGALLTDQPRRASAYAVGNVTLLSLERSIFSSVFDQSLQDMLNRNFEKRKKEADAVIEFTDLEEIRVLGAGSYGQVLLVNNKVTGKTYALKSMSKKRIVELKQQRHVLNEKEILQSIHHPFIVGLKQLYVSDGYVFMLLEAVLGGELFVYMRAAGRVLLRDALFYMAQVVLVFEYLHSNNVIYRDLKPENLLVGANGYLKFIDFGLSKVLHNDRKTYTLCGTPAYAAPEIYNLSGHGKASDWWCLGVLTHELLSGTTPFDGDAEQIFASIEEYSRAYPNIRLPRGLSGDVGDFVLRLLNPNPNRRLGCLPRGGGARDVKNHSLFRNYRWGALINETTRAPFKPIIASGFDTNNFYNPVVRGQPVQLANVDVDSVRIASDWSFPSENGPDIATTSSSRSINTTLST